MHRPRRLLAVVAIAATLAACTGEPDGPDGTFEPIVPGEPAGIEDVVQHLFEAPEFPAPVAGEVVLAELRSEDVSRRHHVFLAELAGGTGDLAEELFPGMVVRIEDGASLTVPTGASVATLEGDEVTSVDDCPAPCEATGPALVAPQEWFQGIRVDAGWQLLVPAPEA